MSIKKMGFIIPIYNAEKYLPSLLCDISLNTYKDVEIIFVIDGANDNSERICMVYSKTDKRCRTIVQTNKGVSAARNFGLKELRGRVEYIGFLDADDRINKHYFQSFANEIERNPKSDIIIGKINCLIYHNGFSFSPFGINAYESNAEIVDAFLKFEFSTAVWGKIYKSDLLAVNFPLININEDFIFNWNVFTVAQKITCVDTAEYSYVIRQEDSLSKCFTKDALSVITLSDMVLDDVKNNYSGMEKTAYSFVAAMLLHTLLMFLKSQITEDSLSVAMQIVDFSYSFEGCRINNYLIDEEKGTTLLQVVEEVKKIKEEFTSE